MGTDATAVDAAPLLSGPEDEFCPQCQRIDASVKAVLSASLEQDRDLDPFQSLGHPRARPQRIVRVAVRHPFPVPRPRPPSRRSPASANGKSVSARLTRLREVALSMVRRRLPSSWFTTLKDQPSRKVLSRKAPPG